MAANVEDCPVNLDRVAEETVMEFGEVVEQLKAFVGAEGTEQIVRTGTAEKALRAFRAQRLSVEANSTSLSIKLAKKAHDAKNQFLETYTQPPPPTYPT